MLFTVCTLCKQVSYTSVNSCIHKGLMASRIFSIRLDDGAVQALERLQAPNDDSLNGTVKRVLLASLGLDVNSSVQPVNNTSDERIQELVDIKTSYLADALNDLRRNLEDEINHLKTQIELLKLSNHVNTSAVSKADRTASNSATETQSEDSYLCPKCGTIGKKFTDFINKGKNDSGTPRLKCKHCGTVRIESQFIKQESIKSESWEQKASTLLDEVNWQ
jgi:hypothetical protein